MFMKLFSFNFNTYDFDHYSIDIQNEDQPPVKDDKYNFFENVYDVVRLIPEGRVTSYGAIARYLGAASSSRMVGWAMNSSHGMEIPAHRVVNRQGILTGKRYFGNGDEMKTLLEAEGIKVVNDKIQNFQEVFWDPIKELGFD